MPIARFNLPYCDPASPGTLGSLAYTNSTRRRLGQAVRALICEQNGQDAPRERDWAQYPYLVSRLCAAPEMGDTDPVTVRFSASQKVRACIALEASRFDWSGIARQVGCRVTHLKRWYARVKVLRARYF